MKHGFVYLEKEYVHHSIRHKRQVSMIGNNGLGSFFQKIVLLPRYLKPFFFLLVGCCCVTMTHFWRDGKTAYLLLNYLQVRVLCTYINSKVFYVCRIKTRQKQNCYRRLKIILQDIIPHNFQHQNISKKQTIPNFYVVFFFLVFIFLW